MLDLKPPVPMPMMTRPTAKQPSAPLGLSITEGMEEQIRTMCPTSAKTIEYWIVCEGGSECLQQLAQMYVQKITYQEPTEIRVSNISTNQWHKVSPELVECLRDSQCLAPQ